MGAGIGVIAATALTLLALALLRDGATTQRTVFEFPEAGASTTDCMRSPPRSKRPKTRLLNSNRCKQSNGY